MIAENSPFFATVSLRYRERSALDPPLPATGDLLRRVRPDGDRDDSALDGIRHRAALP